MNFCTAEVACFLMHIQQKNTVVFNIHNDSNLRVDLGNLPKCHIKGFENSHQQCSLHSCLLINNTAIVRNNNVYKQKRKRE